MVLEWAKDWVVDKVYGVARTGIQAGGNMAGNAVGGVGSLIENSGRGVGQSISGAIGGVGGSINNYGQSIIDSTAASGAAGGEKRYAVKPTQTTDKKRSQQTIAQRSATPARKSAMPTTTKASTVASKPRISASPKQLNQQPSKPPPPAPNRNLPAKRPQLPTSASPTLPKIAASALDRTKDGKVRVSPASKPQTVNSGIPTGTRKPMTAKPLPRIATGRNDRTGDGKVRISPASRPRPVASAR